MTLHPIIARYILPFVIARNPSYFVIARSASDEAIPEGGTIAKDCV